MPRDIALRDFVGNLSRDTPYVTLAETCHVTVRWVILGDMSGDIALRDVGGNKSRDIALGELGRNKSRDTALSDVGANMSRDIALPDFGGNMPRDIPLRDFGWSRDVFSPECHMTIKWPVLVNYRPVSLWSSLRELSGAAHFFLFIFH